MNSKLSGKSGVRGIILLCLALALAACSKNANTGNSANGSSSSGSSTGSTIATTNPSGSTPTDALKTYYDAARRKDIPTVKSYLSRGTLQMMEELAKAQHKSLDQMFAENADKDVEMSTPEFSNEKVSGDTASVDIKSPNHPLVTVQMVQEDGRWKLAIDKMMGGRVPKPAGE